MSTETFADATGNEDELVQTDNGPEDGQPVENQDTEYIPEDGK